jgi:hypothetical protein
MSKMAGVRGVLLLFPARLPNLASALALLLACDLTLFGTLWIAIWIPTLICDWSMG